MEHIRGHLWRRYSITVNQVVVATWWLQLKTNDHFPQALWFLALKIKRYFLSNLLTMSVSDNSYSKITWCTLINVREYQRGSKNGQSRETGSIRRRQTKQKYNTIYISTSLFQILTGATSGAGTAYPSRTPEFTPGFKWGSCYSILYFFFWPLRCLFFFDIRNLIAPLVSSNSSCINFEKRCNR